VNVTVTNTNDDPPSISGHVPHPLLEQLRGWDQKMGLSDDDPPPPYSDPSPSAPAMVAVPTAANSMGLAERLKELERADAQGLLTPEELRAARKSAIDGCAGVTSGGGVAEAGAHDPSPFPQSHPLHFSPAERAAPAGANSRDPEILGCWACCCFPLGWALFSVEDQDVRFGPDKLILSGVVFVLWGLPIPFMQGKWNPGDADGCRSVACGMKIS